MLKKIITIALVLIMALSLTACGKETMNLNDYLSVKFDGTNGDGTAVITGFMDFEEDLMQKAGEVNIGSLLVVETGINYQLDKKDGLSNGDVVTMTISIDEDLNKSDKIPVKITGTTKTFTVSGLPEKVYTDFDPFEKDMMLCDGISPYLSVYVNNDNVDWEICNKINGSYEIKPLDPNKSKYSNGEKVIIAYKYDENKADENAIRVVQVEKEYTIDGFDSYIQSWDDLTADEQNKIITEAQDILNAKISEPLGIYWGIDAGPDYGEGAMIWADDSNPVSEYLGTYHFNHKTGNYISWDDFYCCERMVFKASLKWDDSSAEAEPYDIYFMMSCENLIRTNDGYLIYDSSMLSYNGWYKYFNTDILYNEQVVANKDNYNIEGEIDFN